MLQPYMSVNQSECSLGNFWSRNISRSFSAFLYLDVGLSQTSRYTPRGPGRRQRSTSASYTTTTDHEVNNDDDVDDASSTLQIDEKMLHSPMSKLLYDVGHEMFTAEDDSADVQDAELSESHLDDNTPAQVVCSLNRGPSRFCDLLLCHFSLYCR